MGSEFQFEAIGTHWKITIDDTLQPAAESTLESGIRDRIEIFDHDYSRFRKDSLVTEMATYAGTYTLPQDAQELLNLYRELYMITGGLFTPLAGQVLSDAGYDAEYSMQTKAMEQAPEWGEVMEFDPPKLTIKKPVLIDVGGAGKGYLVDIVSDLISQSGVDTFVINAGGDIVVRNTIGTPTRVALEHPDDATKAIGVANIVNQSICGSSGNRRAWGEFHHIINPKTLTSPKHIKAVWVVAPRAIIADALATCLFFVTPSSFVPRFEFEYLCVNEDNTVEASPHFPAELFTSSQLV